LRYQSALFLLAILSALAWPDPVLASGPAHHPERELNCSTVMVSMGHFAVFRPSATYQRIGTQGLGPCIGVVIHDPKTGWTALAHVSGGDDVADSVALMMQRLREHGSDLSELKVREIGGWDAASYLQAEINQSLAKYTVTIVEQDPLFQGGLNPNVLFGTALLPLSSSPCPGSTSGSSGQSAIRDFEYDPSTDQVFDIDPDSLPAYARCPRVPIIESLPSTPANE
jgi:hypothetical protein